MHTFLRGPPVPKIATLIVPHDDIGDERVVIPEPIAKVVLFREKEAIKKYDNSVTSAAKIGRGGRYLRDISQVSFINVVLIHFGTHETITDLKLTSN